MSRHGALSAMKFIIEQPDGSNVTVRDIRVWAATHDVDIAGTVTNPPLRRAELPILRQCIGPIWMGAKQRPRKCDVHLHEQDGDDDGQGREQRKFVERRNASSHDNQRFSR
jgi:hypothetical protein